MFAYSIKLVRAYDSPFLSFLRISILSIKTDACHPWNIHICIYFGTINMYKVCKCLVRLISRQRLHNQSIGYVHLVEVTQFVACCKFDQILCVTIKLSTYIIALVVFNDYTALNFLHKFSPKNTPKLASTLNVYRLAHR